MFGQLDAHHYIGNIVISKIVIYRGSVPYILLLLLPGHSLFIIIPGISLYSGSLYRGSTV